MAPSLPSCKGTSFCSHRQAFWVLVAALLPFALPFLILCIPLLLLFAAPLFPLLVSVLVLYKAQARIFGVRKKDDGEWKQVGLTSPPSLGLGEEGWRWEAPPGSSEDDGNLQSLAGSDACSPEDMYSAEEMYSAASSSNGGFTREELPHTVEELWKKEGDEGRGRQDIEEEPKESECLQVPSPARPSPDSDPRIAEVQEEHSGEHLEHSGEHLGVGDFGVGKSELQSLPSPSMEEEGFEQASCRAADESASLGDFDTAQEGGDMQLENGMAAAGSEACPHQEHAEWHHSSQSSSSTTSPTHSPPVDIELQHQEKMEEELKILTDVSSIQKIVGYQGETHASAMEQIMALYMFLGMEPCELDEEMDELETARAHVELLKVVVGVK